MQHKMIEQQSLVYLLRVFHIFGCVIIHNEIVDGSNVRFTGQDGSYLIKHASIEEF